MKQKIEMQHLPINQIVCGDARLIADWAPDSIDMMITSPPYWQMRKYGEDEVKAIWGGDKECEHRWKTEIKKNPLDRGGKGQFDEYRHFGALMGAERTTKPVEYAFCLKCNAWRGQLGLEPTPELYIANILEVTALLKRVLKPYGSLYLNLGDKYTGNEGLLDLPGRISNAMKQQGWKWKDRIIWRKPNPMPFSGKTRLTNTYEYINRFVKNRKTLFWHNEKTGQITAKKPPTPKDGIEGVDWEWREVPVEDEEPKRKKVSFWHGHDCWYDLDAIREPPKWEEVWSRRGASEDTPYEINNPRKRWGVTRAEKHAGIHKEQAGKNPGDVFFDPGDFWTIPTQPCPEAHFATFPEAICEKPILSSCPLEICKKCGLPRVRISEVNYNPVGHKKNEKKARVLHPRVLEDIEKSRNNISDYRPQAMKYGRAEAIRNTIGWTDCGCNADWEAGIALDPFCGTGTVCAVAKKNGRRYIGIDISPQYCEMAETKLAKTHYQMDMFD